MNCLYRITGPQSIERIEPLLKKLEQPLSFQFKLVESSVNLNSSSEPSETDEKLLISSSLDLVWETYCEKEWRERHNSAKILNRLSNSQIFEDKGNFAFLQLRMTCPHLKSFIALNRTILYQWCQQKWKSSNLSTETIISPRPLIDLTQLANQSFLNEPYEWNTTLETIETNDWWIIKASRGNGGKDIWIINQENYETVLPTLHEREEYVIQRYISNPLLWNHRKFHFRCYGVITATHAGYLYEKCYILSAALPYVTDQQGEKRETAKSEEETEKIHDNRHITNLSINKRFPNHPGQVPCHLPTECPNLFQQISSLWNDLITSSSPFLTHQYRSSFFEFVGFDVICDSYGICYILECNRCPGLESSHNRCREQEEVMYNEMMTSLLEMMCREHLTEQDKQQTETVSENSDRIFPDEVNVTLPSQSYWKCVRESTNIVTSDAVYLNLFNWKAFTKKNREKILVAIGS